MPGAAWEAAWAGLEAGQCKAGVLQAEHTLRAPGKLFKHGLSGPTPETQAQTSEVGSESLPSSQASGGAGAATPETTLRE